MLLAESEAIPIILDMFRPLAASVVINALNKFSPVALLTTARSTTFVQISSAALRSSTKRMSTASCFWVLQSVVSSSKTLYGLSLQLLKNSLFIWGASTVLINVVALVRPQAYLLAILLSGNRLATIELNSSAAEKAWLFFAKK